MQLKSEYENLKNSLCKEHGEVKGVELFWKKVNEDDLEEKAKFPATWKEKMVRVNTRLAADKIGKGTDPKDVMEELTNLGWKQKDAQRIARRAYNHMTTPIGEDEEDDDEIFEEKSLVSSIAPELKDGKVIGTSGVLIDSKPDLYRDICTKACLKDMVKQLNDRTFTMDLEHASFRGKNDLEKQLNKATIPIAKIVEATYVDTKDGHAHVHIKDRLNHHHSRYDEVEGSIRDDFLNAYSIAFVPQVWERKSVDNQEYRILHKVGMLNVAHTGVPVNPRSERESIQLKARDVSDELFKKFAGLESSDDSQIHTGLTIEAKARNSEETKMSNETKTNPEAPAEEATMKSLLAALETRVQENDVALKALQAEVKAMKEDEKKEDEEDEEKKKKGEAEQKALSEKDAMIAQLKAKVEEHEKFLSQPNFKARVDALAAATVAANAKVEEKAKGKLKGPFDNIQ